jgi:hypothetical protein
MREAWRIFLQPWNKECHGKLIKKTFMTKVSPATRGLLFGNNISV